MRRTSLLSLFSALTLAAALALPASPAGATGAGVYAGACPLASFTVTGTSGPIDRLPGSMTLTLTITGSSCVIDTAAGVTVSLNAPVSSSSFGCFGGVASGTGTFTEGQSTRNVGVILVNAGGTWTVLIHTLPALTLLGTATGASFPIACALGTPAPSLTALGSLAFEDPELTG
jgi:hypothetical protein